MVQIVQKASNASVHLVPEHDVAWNNQNKCAELTHWYLQYWWQPLGIWQNRAGFEPGPRHEVLRGYESFHERCSHGDYSHQSVAHHWKKAKGDMTGQDKTRGVKLHLVALNVESCQMIKTWDLLCVHWLPVKAVDGGAIRRWIWTPNTLYDWAVVLVTWSKAVEIIRQSRRA